MKQRKYQLKKRAEKQEETRQRIVRAISDLHRTVGPAATTVSAVAEQAGVQRLTVYRHFPDEEAMVAACGADWLKRYPLPAPGEWTSIEDAGARTEAAFAELYRYYADTADMMDNIFRDAPKVPALQQAMEEMAGYYEACRSVLLEPWGVEGATKELTGAAIGAALEFGPWQALARQGLDPERAAALMTQFVRYTAKEGSG